MVRVLIIAAAAVLLMGASRPSTVDYRLGVQPSADGPPVLDVELRLRGDADGETVLRLPDGVTTELQVRGGRIEPIDKLHSRLRHRPGAKLTIRYAVRAMVGGTDRGASLGETIYAVPQDRDLETTTFRWRELPKGWQAATDLEHGALGWPMTVADVRPSVLIAGDTVSLAERKTSDGTMVRVAVAGSAQQAEALAETAAPVIAAAHAFWNSVKGPYLVVAGPFTQAYRDRGDGTALAVGGLADPGLQAELARTQMRAWFPERLGRGLAAPWFSVGFADFFGDRSLLRAGQVAPKTVAADLAEADASQDAGRRGALLALKWDEDIRRKSGGKLDLDDVILRMRDHYRQFPAGQGPDVGTGLVSAAWTVAGLDLRPDIARYAEGGAVIPLPETLFDGCLDARVTVAPAFDSGFDHDGSFAAKTIRGVRRGGPAWNSGVRDGMALEAWTFRAGDMNREIELNVRPAGKRAKSRKIRFWPYGDADVETRKLQVAVGLSDTEAMACGRKIGGL